MLIQTTSKRLIELIEDLVKDLKKDQELSKFEKTLILDGAMILVTSLLNITDDETLETVEVLNRIKAEFDLYLILIDD